MRSVNGFVSRPVIPTCILFPDAFSFIGGHNALLEAGYVLPRLSGNRKAMSAMGYDGINLARMMLLTTYTQNAVEIGRTAASRLIQLIEEPDTASREPVLVSGALLEGASVVNLNP